MSSIIKLKNGMKFRKATTRPKDKEGRLKPLTGTWTVTIKVDGVRAFKTAEGWLSRASKPLYNLDHLDVPVGSNYEIFRQDWKTSVSLVRTRLENTGVTMDDLYRLDPASIDDRLIICTLLNPTEKELQALLKEWREKDQEGLVIYQDEKIYKIKPIDYADVRITGYVEGEGKHAGRLGLFTTNYGNVGTGFSDAEREEYWSKRDEMIGKIIEVSFMEWTPDGFFRHPVFERDRFDKDEENLGDNHD